MQRVSREFLRHELREMHLEIEDFLRKNIGSYEELEVLLAIHGSAGEYLSVMAIASQVRISPANAREALRELSARSLLCQRGAHGQTEYGFPFWNRRLASVVNGLDQAWKNCPLEVARLMDAAAIGRVRSAAARAFSDAFRVKVGVESTETSHQMANQLRLRKARGT